MRTLPGRTALLTGASRGLGPLIADRLGAHGLRLMLVARDAAGLEAEAQRLRAAGVTVGVFAGDVTDPEAMQRAIDAAVALGGGLQVLVNNAGVDDMGHFADASPASIARTLAINLTAPLQLARLALPRLLEADEAQIINIASVAGLLGTPYGAVYAASKAGLIAGSLSLRMELSGGPVGVSAICPAFVHGAGMHEVHKQAIGRAPLLLGGTTAEATADAVLDAIRNNPAEVIVNDSPLRPLVGLGRTLPGLSGWLTLRAAGAYMKRLADARRG
jgi:short-subunit dehydrogenase